MANLLLLLSHALVRFSLSLPLPIPTKKNTQSLQKYYGKFSLGTPPQNFTACFDTGSTDTWVPGDLCLTPSCTSHARFSPGKSSTYKLLPEPFRMAYGTGAATGSSAVETLTLGEPPISVPNQPFGIVVDASHDFRATSCDGLVGLGLDALSVMRKTPVFTNMIKQNLVERNVFAWWLSNDPAREPAGRLTLGGVDPSLYSGEITWAPVVTKGYWTVQLDGVRRQGGNGTLVSEAEEAAAAAAAAAEAAKNATAAATATEETAEAAAAPAAAADANATASPPPPPTPPPKPRPPHSAAIETSRAILDSGTTAIIVTRKDAAAIHAGIKGIKMMRGGYYNVTGGCSAVDDLPDMVFTINGVDYAVPPRLWTQRIPARKGEDPEKMCISAILPGPTTAEKGIILGDAFMRQWYTVYEKGGSGEDGKGARIGFARSAKGEDVPEAALKAVAPPLQS